VIWLAALAVAAASSTPLLDYARGLQFDVPPHADRYQRQLVRSTHELERQPAPDKDCARTLGARRFAAQLEELGGTRDALGDSAGALEAFRSALACTPRAIELHASLAEELLHERRYAEARAAVRRGQEVTHDDFRLGTVQARLDFIEEHWSDAVSSLRWVAGAARDNQQALYWECFLWLAQRRSGVPHPVLVDRTLGQGWPKPVLDTLQNALTEGQLLDVVQSEGDAERRREILTEALYYIGENRFANGDRDSARRYFAATVNLKVLYFIEHHMALAELAKLPAVAH
jgi:tetratricopeptide (TPR) repeat protein